MIVLRKEIESGTSACDALRALAINSLEPQFKLLEFKRSFRLPTTTDRSLVRFMSDQKAYATTLAEKKRALVPSSDAPSSAKRLKQSEA